MRWHLTLDQLLRENNSFHIYHRTLQILATEMYKAKNNLSLTLIQRIFPDKEIPYNL